MSTLALLLLVWVHTRNEAGRSLDGIIEFEQRGLGFEVGGSVLRVEVRRGDAVRKGQILARIDDTLERALRPAREAEFTAAEERLRLVESGARITDIRAMNAQVRAAAALVKEAKKELNRHLQLLPQGATTQAVVDSLRARLDSASAQRNAMHQRLGTLRAGSQPSEIRAAAAARDGAKAALDAADRHLDRYLLHAPSDGLILDVTAQAGEVLPPGGIAILFTQPETPYVDIFVPVPELVGVQAGQGATVFPDGDARPFSGKIDHIAVTTEFTPRYLLSPDDRKNLVVRVRIRIADPQRQLHGGVPCRVKLLAARP